MSTRIPPAAATVVMYVDEAAPTDVAAAATATGASGTGVGAWESPAWERPGVGTCSTVTGGPSANPRVTAKLLA